MLSHPPTANQLQKDNIQLNLRLLVKIDYPGHEDCLLRHNSNHTLPQRDKTRALLTLTNHATHLTQITTQVWVRRGTKLHSSSCNTTTTGAGLHMARLNTMPTHAGT